MFIQYLLKENVPPYMYAHIHTHTHTHTHTAIHTFTHTKYANEKTFGYQGFEVLWNDQNIYFHQKC